MSVLDKALAAITPAPSAERRKQATEDARAAAVPGGWLAMALDHHDEIRLGFRKGGSAATPTEMSQAMRALALILNGHSQAEEVVLYPAMAQHRHKSQAGVAYSEQTTVKMQMAELENISPSEPEWLDKWAHIEGAVLTHMYEEEHGWFIHLNKHAPDQDRLTSRFAEEYSRYVGVSPES